MNLLLSFSDQMQAIMSFELWKDLPWAVSKTEKLFMSLYALKMLNVSGQLWQYYQQIILLIVKNYKI